MGYLSTLLVLVFTCLSSKVYCAMTQFSHRTVYVEMDSVGTALLGRFNVSSWPDPEADMHKIKVIVQELRLLSSDGQELYKKVYVSNHNRYFSMETTQIHEYEGLRVQARKMKTKVENYDLWMSFSLNIFSQSGTISQGGIQQDVERGYVGVGVSFEQGEECDPCADIAFTEVKMNIIGEGDVHTSFQDRVTKVMLDEGVTVWLPNKVKSDGEWLDTQPSYPQVRNQENTADITLRFPSFDQSASYGITIKPANLEALRKVRQETPEEDVVVAEDARQEEDVKEPTTEREVSNNEEQLQADQPVETEPDAGASDVEADPEVKPEVKPEVVEEGKVEVEEEEAEKAPVMGQDTEDTSGAVTLGKVSVHMVAATVCLLGLVL